MPASDQNGGSGDGDNRELIEEACLSGDQIFGLIINIAGLTCITWAANAVYGMPAATMAIGCWLLMVWAVNKLAKCPDCNKGR